MSLDKSYLLCQNERLTIESLSTKMKWDKKADASKRASSQPFAYPHKLSYLSGTKPFPL